MKSLGSRDDQDWYQSPLRDTAGVIAMAYEAGELVMARDLQRIQAAVLTDVPALVQRLDELARQVDQWPLLNDVGPRSASTRPAKAKPARKFADNPVERADAPGAQYRPDDAETDAQQGADRRQAEGEGRALQQQIAVLQDGGEVELVRHGSALRAQRPAGSGCFSHFWLSASRLPSALAAVMI